MAALANQVLEIGASYGFGQAPQTNASYDVQIPAPGEVTIHLDNWHSTFDWGMDFDKVYVYNSESVAVSRNSFSSPEDPYLFHMIEGNTGMKFRVGKAGLYTIVVHSGQIRNWGTATNQAYTMSITATYCPDANEPNETMATATPLGLNSTLTAYPWKLVNTSSIWGDEDWYKIDVPSPGMLQLNLSYWIGVYDWGKDFDRLYVYNAAGTSIGSRGGNDFYGWMMGGGTDSVPNVIQMNLTHAGTYYLRFHAGVGVSMEPYHLKAIFTPANDPYEPNDNIGSAKPIPSVETWHQAYAWRSLDSTMNVYGDEDYYSFEAPAGGSYSIQLSGWIGIYDWGKDYDRIWILDAQGNVVGPNPLGWMMGTGPINFSVPAAGKYYILLHCGGTYALAGYQFRFVGNILGSTPTEQRPNGFSVTPNPAKAWVKLNLPTASTQQHVRIVALDGSLVLSTKVDTECQLNVSTLKPGLYLLECTSDGRTFRQKLLKE